jgi:hypothetical protein
MTTDNRLRAALANLVRHIEINDYVNAQGTSLTSTHVFQQARRALTAP